jgi:hypothetical protein
MLLQVDCRARCITASRLQSVFNNRAKYVAATRLCTEVVLCLMASSLPRMYVENNSSVYETVVIHFFYSFAQINLHRNCIALSVWYVCRNLQRSIIL